MYFARHENQNWDKNRQWYNKKQKSLMKERSAIQLKNDFLYYKVGNGKRKINNIFLNQNDQYMTETKKHSSFILKEKLIKVVDLSR